ncbi:hypothetical protein J1N35_018173 [Gossypium stocksii]|uniref:Retrotransposon gag domain-containing protein n=1 Tax=Gossypium stocksii TaxID=47602 RepID=A0A9D3VNG8_9ROSI|nr:hypothetical protein J1N35_018173 [Gossypium stocksii]
MYHNKQLASWSHFTSTLIKRFQPRDLESPEGQLAKLQQTTTVGDYRARFEAITNRTMFLPPLFLVHCFISGLRPDLKTAVLIHKPTELEDIIGLAQLHEQRFALEKGFIKPTLGLGKPILTTPKIVPSSASSIPNTPAPTNLATLSSGAKAIAIENDDCSYRGCGCQLGAAF